MTSVTWTAVGWRRDNRRVKASELIAKLQARIAQDGDLPVFILRTAPAVPVKWVAPGSSGEVDDPDAPTDKIVIGGRK
jgi:hypothetical protein